MFVEVIYLLSVALHMFRPAGLFRYCEIVWENSLKLSVVCCEFETSWGKLFLLRVGLGLFSVEIVRGFFRARKKIYGVPPPPFHHRRHIGYYSEEVSRTREVRIKKQIFLIPLIVDN